MNSVSPIAYVLWSKVNEGFIIKELSLAPSELEVRGIPSPYTKVGQHNTHEVDNYNDSIGIKRVPKVNNHNAPFWHKEGFHIYASKFP